MLRHVTRHADQLTRQFQREPEAAVADVQVIGIPCSRYGEEIVAWVRLQAGQSADQQQLQAYCRENIAHFKVPRHFHFVDEFPMTVTGKIQKFKMRELSIELFPPPGGH